MSLFFFFFQAEDGIRDLVRSRGLGDVYKRQDFSKVKQMLDEHPLLLNAAWDWGGGDFETAIGAACLLYTSDAADERSSVDLGGRRIIKKKTKQCVRSSWYIQKTRRKHVSV